MTGFIVSVFLDTRLGLFRQLSLTFFRKQIRLPFGRKKKSQDAHGPPAVPARSSHLTPPQERTLSEGEDIEPVKQLTGMGFSREVAVAALEGSSYDFQRALNSLLGTE